MTGGHPNLIDAAAALAFAGLVLCGLWLTRRRQAEEIRRSRVSLFLLYALGASFAAGLTQRDLWPFAAWPIKSLTPLPVASEYVILAVDDRGDEQAIDYRAWQPIGVDELLPWLMIRFPDLDPAAQERTAAFLLLRAEAARQRALAQGKVGSFDRVLGPLTAPYYLLHPRRWRGRDGVPPRPFVRLRVYRDAWSQLERRQFPDRVARFLVYEHPRP